MDFLKDFGVQPILLAAQVVNFLILLFILKKFLYGPIIKVLEVRRKKIEESLKKAEEIERRLAETNEKIDKMMAKASLEAQEIVEEAKKARIQIIEEAHQKGAQDAEKIIKKAVEVGRVETERMMSEARSQLLTLATNLLYKVTGKLISKEDDKRLIEREVKNLS